MGRYGRVLANRDARTILVLAVFARMPAGALGIVITLHVVVTLGYSYARAGVAAMAIMICLGVSGPWRGRLLDRAGLRKVVPPSLAITVVCWVVAPFAGYWPLVVLASVAALFAPPVFTIARQGVLAAVPATDRRAALALDSVGTEFSFIAGPLLGVAAIGLMPSSWVLAGIQGVSVVIGVLVCIVNPPLRAAASGDPRPADAPGRRQWMPPLLMLCFLAAVTVMVGAATELGIVAALRRLNAAELAGAGVAVWCAGSAIGGLAYGAAHRAVPMHWLMAVLALVTFPVALAPNVLTLGVLLFVAGLLWAPTITASLDQLSQVVPEGARGEAIGWHGSAMALGNGAGPPIAGYAADHGGPPAAFLVAGLLCLTGAVLGGLASVYWMKLGGSRVRA